MSFAADLASAGKSTGNLGTFIDELAVGTVLLFFYPLVLGGAFNQQLLC